ncbi:MFS transporter [Salinibacterium sp. dk2585]|uniref:MFS transporter n=1 Tax=unclassified Salinibacterium TaxID=2632331 RepID=UPI0011C25513|nr:MULTISPECIES: MFS transporter [unclassified Salinibacterium]QEE62055.1 MFS transporter [Salinibacterium sp. dk2585]TXK53407.1 MFS transporter [Salinibacterium sp. dk5596]
MGSLSSIRSRVGFLTGALVVLMPLSQLGFIPVSALLGERLGIGAAAIGLAIGLYAISAAVATVLFGPLFDLYPVRRILPWAVCINLAVSLAFIWVPNLEMLIVGRILAGLANSALALSASVIVADAFRDRPGDRDRAYSGLQTFVSTGAITGLALGGLCAGLGQPWLYFAIVAAYAAIILCITPLILRRMRTVTAAQTVAEAGASVDADAVHALETKAAASSPAAVLRGIVGFMREPQTILLLVATACASWVLQSGHYGLSMLLNEVQPDIVLRTVLTVVIPVGVLLGALINQWSLGRRGPRGVYGRAYLLLPLAGGVLAVALLTQQPAAWAAGLLCVGIVCGMLGPLQPTIMIGWYPDLRGSASASVSVSQSIGAALGPIAIGALAAVWSLSGAVLIGVGVALVGAVLAAVLGRGDTGPHVAEAEFAPAR